MMLIGIKQHLSNMRSLIHEEVKQHRLSGKEVSLIKKTVYLKHVLNVSY